MFFWVKLNDLCFYWYVFTLICKYITDTFSAVPDAPADCAITTLIYNQSSGMLLFINSIWDAVKVSKLPNIALG